VAEARKKWPGIDGVYVAVLAAILSAVLVFVSSPSTWKIDLAPRAVRVFGLVVGGFSLVGYAAKKVGGAPSGSDEK
jgi:hypothetical protein